MSKQKRQKISLQKLPLQLYFQGYTQGLSSLQTAIYRCFCGLPFNRSLGRSEIISFSGIDSLTLRCNWNFLNRMNRFREHSLRLLVALKKPGQFVWAGIIFDMLKK
jgi:hypothetical protein